MRARISFHLRAFDDPAAPVGGQLEALTTFEQALVNGTTANTADLVHKSTQTIAGSGNSDIDLRALEDVFGDAMSTLTEVVALVLEADADNGATLSIKPSASNGWTALLADATDILKLAPGGKFVLLAPGDGLYTVGASNKSINVANSDGSSAGLTITLIGRSA